MKAELDKVHDECLHHEDRIFLDADSLRAQRYRAYNSGNTEEFRSIIPCLNSIAEEVEALRNYLMEIFGLRRKVGKGNMERLTSNKPVSEMSMYELSHNACYAKDRKARVRDFEDDSDARELTIKLLEKYADIPNEFTCDEDFDDFMADSLQYGTDDSILGLIAVFYRNLWAMADLRERLRQYEDLEEQGKLMELPCAVGDTVWDNGFGQPRSHTVTGFSFGKIDDVEEIDIDGLQVHYRNWDGSIRYSCAASEIGESVFLTRGEAEEALKRMEGGK